MSTTTSSRLTSECTDFGPILGELDVLQYSGTAFQRQCSSSSSLPLSQCKGEEDVGDDATGLRLHVGTHVLVRLFPQLSRFFPNRTVVEVGAGLGLSSICLNLLTAPILTLITDGNEETLEIAQLNCSRLLKEKENTLIVKRLNWSSEEDLLQVMSVAPNGFDVVIGSDLMYFNINIAELLTVVTSLTKEKKNSFFLHAHKIRKYGQLQQLADSFLNRFNWMTILLPIESFISAEELSHHPEWHSVVCLCTGSNKVVEDLRAQLDEERRCRWMSMDDYLAACRLEEEEAERCDILKTLLL